MTQNVEQIAVIAHETNRAYCASIGDPSQMTPETQMAQVQVGDWVAFMNQTGIVYGRVEYIYKQDHWPWGLDIITTAGTVDVKRVLEVRRGQ